jgi:hypothetical protein
MPKQPDDIARMARQIIAAYPQHPARSLAKRLVQESNGAITLETARMRIRSQLGQAGDRKRKLKTGLERPARSPGEGVAMPASRAAKWQPYDPKLPGLWGVLSDIHVPYHSEVALRAAVEHLKQKQIVGLLLNGDIADFYSISRYVKNPANRDFGAELAQVRQLLKWLRSEFPGVKMSTSRATMRSVISTGYGSMPPSYRSSRRCLWRSGCTATSMTSKWSATSCQ